MIERNEDGTYRIPLLWGWAIGFSSYTKGQRFVAICRYKTGGWSLRVLWFHIGRKKDRENWTHHATK